MRIFVKICTSHTSFGLQKKKWKKSRMAETVLASHPCNYNLHHLSKSLYTMMMIWSTINHGINYISRKKTEHSFGFVLYSLCCYSNPDHYSNALVIIAFEIHEQYTWLPTYSSWLVSCSSFSCNHVNNFQQKRHNTIELILNWWHRRAWCASDAVLE